MKLCGTSSCPLQRVLQQKNPLPNEELILGTQEQHIREVSVSVTPVQTSHGDYAVFTARDLSALKVANQVRSNFVSMVSHELRTPLNSVHGFIDLLLQGHMGDLNEEQRTYLGYAQEGVQQLISIVQDILFMTRSDLGQFEIKQQEVQLRILVRQVVSGMQPQASKASVVLNSDIPTDMPLLYVDPQRIKQVLNNLISNAIKYTPPGGSITISASALSEDWVMISVIDTGYGILTEDRPHIFERFYQSNQREQSRMGGYGLGLSIARLIVEQHGGTISFESVLEKGTTFYFTVPVYHGQGKENI
jgi:two-component system phosphate regulon sensor histidine kinase PhoR